MNTVSPRKLRPSQKLGVSAWRTMMGVFGLLSSLRRRSLPDSMSEQAYGSHPAERLEVIDRSAGSPPLAPVVYVHGGGWICGKKEMYTQELLFLTEVGHPVFNVEYPMAPERPHPHMLLSLLSALAWIREQHPDVETVHLMGDSAGGNLVMMLAIMMANPQLIQQLDPDASFTLPRIKSVISIYGVLDRLSWIEKGFPSAALMLESYAGPEAFEPEVGAQHAVTPMDVEFDVLPPTLITCGSKDQLAESSRICAEALQKRFEPVEYQVYPGENHGFFNRAGRPAAEKLRNDILAFLSKY